MFRRLEGFRVQLLERREEASVHIEETLTVPLKAVVVKSSLLKDNFVVARACMHEMASRLRLDRVFRI